MTISIGEKIPSLSLRTMTEEGPISITTEEIFSGKKVVLFAVPGAFTPTCSVQHLPGFVTSASEIKAKGADTVACISVNDPFVMGAWAKEKGVNDQLLMLSDGNCEFTSAIGLEMDGTGFGLGKRSQRYAMIVDDGVVSVLNIEAGPKLEVSSAESILKEM